MAVGMGKGVFVKGAIFEKVSQTGVTKKSAIVKRKHSRRSLDHCPI